MKPEVYGKVAVLRGGPSAEREVSLKGGTAVLAALRRTGVDAHGIDAGRDVAQLLAQGGFDRAFIMLHGPWGEDGVIRERSRCSGCPTPEAGCWPRPGHGQAAQQAIVRLRRHTDAGVPRAQAGHGGAGGAGTVGCAAGGQAQPPGFERRGEQGVCPGWIRGGLGRGPAVRRLRACRALGERPRDHRQRTGQRGVAVDPDRNPRTSFTTTTPSITPTARAITVRRSCRRRRPRRLRRLAHAAFELLGGRGWGRVDFMVDHAAIPMCWRSIPCRA